MKIKSTYGKDVYFEKWQTPMTEGENIWLIHQFMRNGGTYFFFNLYSDQFKKIYVMKISRYSPFRITEECNAVGFISRYFSTKKNTPKSIYKNSNNHPISTWKLWGSQYIKEIDYNYALSGYKKKHNKSLFEYIIQTQEVWIEFISRFEPEWAVYENKTLEELVTYYMKIET
jgi:hypothetical protein